jgi:hypothetical protein
LLLQDRASGHAFGPVWPGQSLLLADQTSKHLTLLRACAWGGPS